MKTFSSLLQLAALGALSSAACVALAGPDTSQWKCETCPFEKAGRSGTVDAGAIGVSDDSAKFGDYSGFDRRAGYVGLSGRVRYVGGNGVYGTLEASDLGLDSRSIEFDGGREGLYALRLGFAEIPRHQADGARAPYLGVGGARLTLPGGFPAIDTASMPLSSTLQAVDVSSKRSRFDAGFTWLAGDAWSTQLTYRRDVRDGLQRTGGSFFVANASQFVAPLDHTTDQLELTALYTTRRLQATLAYQVSLFRNGEPSLVWANPFSPVAGGNAGQLALPPANQSHQLVATVGYQVTPTIRASGDIAFGRMTQNESYLPITVNTTLAASVPALPVQSLDGLVNTFNASARVTASPMSGLNLHASYDRNARDNRTDSRSYPSVSTDMFLNATARTNQPFSFFQDRFRVGADYRLAGTSVKTSAGIDSDFRERSLQEVVTTREYTAWGRIEGRAADNLLLQLKLAHGQRDGTTHGTAAWIDPPQNPLMRKFYLADRRRQSAGVRADFTPAENVTVGFNADYANDDYTDTTLGLTESRTHGFGGDMSAALSDQTQVHAFAQFERSRADQAGSQLFAAPDWTGRSADNTRSVGAGVKQLALGGKLELNADAVRTRMHNDVIVSTAAASPPFPTIATSVDRLQVRAVYQLQKDLSLVGSWRWERYRSSDWHLDGVDPATISNMLALGDPAPRYKVSLLHLGIRYRF